MANQNNLTIYQRLNKVLNGNENEQTKFVINRELIKDLDPQSYEREKLEAQQSLFLQGLWKKIDSELYQKAVFYEPTRIASYYDFEAMEFTPEIGAALDLYMEESCTANENGTILQIYSESDRIKKVLEELFFDVLDISTNLPPWTRNICKYGDNFVYLKVLPSKGVVGCKQLPNIEMTRVEPDFQKVTSLNDLNREPNVKFFWKNKDLEFNSFEMAHFRLLGDDRRLPYGTCLKYNSYVETEYGIKEIKDIQKNDKVWSFDITTEQRVLSPVLDTVYSGVKPCFKISTKHNYIEASEEHKVLVFSSIKENFIEKNVADLKVGDLLVIDNTEKQSNPVLIFKNKPTENKNGWFNCIDVLPNIVDNDFARFFGFMLGDGWISGNGVYFALSKYDELNDFYVSLLNKYTANTVKYKNNSQAYAWSKMLKYVLQSMGFNGTATTKRIPKWVYELSPELQESFVQGLIDADGWSTTDKWSTHINIELANRELLEDFKLLIQRLGYKSGMVRSRAPRGKDVIIEGRKVQSTQPSYLFTFYYSHITQHDKFNPLHRKSNTYITEPIVSINAIGEYDTYDIYVENENHNFYANGIVVHNSMLDKARRIWKQLMMSEDAMLTYRISRAAERRIYKVFVGNMDDKDVDAYVDKVANTFRRTPVVDAANGQTDLRYNMLSVDQDIFVPSRDPALPNPIDTLPGATNLDAIADIKYMQNKLLTALRIPRPFIGFDEAQGDGKNLAMMDVRFARTIYRIQKALIQELNKIAIIHLYLKGFEDEVSNFTLTLTNPSTQQDLLKIERWREKVMLYRDAVTSQDGGFAAMSATKAKKEILDMSDDEIKLDIQRQAVEKAATEELKVLTETIKQTGIFKDLYDIYNIDPNNLMIPGGQGQEGGDMGGGGGGGGGMGGILGEPPPPEGAEGEEGLPDADAGFVPEGGDEAPPEDVELDDLKEQFFRNGKNLRLEAKRASTRLEKRNFILNEDVNDMVRRLSHLGGEKTLLT